VTAACCLDYDTVAGGDKFGNLFVARLESDAGAAEDDASAEPLLDAGAPLGTSLSLFLSFSLSLFLSLSLSLSLSLELSLSLSHTHTLACV